jgi:hypothetical protein
MLGPDYWNAGMSFLFGTGFPPPTSTRCSPVTSNCTSSWYSITSKLYLVPRRDKVQRVGVLPTFCESSPSSKLLQAQQSTIWWTNTCPWHGGITTMRLHSSTMLGACLLQPHGAIYSQSRASGSWGSDDTVTTWSRGSADMCVIKGDDFISLSHDVFVASALMMPGPPQSHMATLTPSIHGQFVVSRWQENLRPLLTRDPAVHGT